MSLFQARILVVKDYVRRLDLDIVAQEQGWVLREEVMADAQFPYQKQWVTEDEQIAYLYVEDSRMKVRYVEVRAVEIEEAVAEVRKLFDSYTDEELKAGVRMAQTPEQWQDALHKAAVGAPAAFDGDYFRCFLSGLEHPERSVKLAAMEAAPYVKWRQFEQPLMRLQQADPQVSREAGFMLEAMREHVWNAGEPA